MTKIAVIGGGSWATALVKILSEHSVKISWWHKNPEDVRHILSFRTNPRYLSDVQHDLQKVYPSSDLKEVLKETSIVILAVPSAFIADALGILSASDFRDKIIVSAIKGMIPGENMLVTDYMHSRYGVRQEDLCVIAGPCHSEEVAMEKRSYLTIAGTGSKNTARIAELLSGRFVKASVVADLYGIEYCAIMKNIIAMACGVARGLNYGDNFQAVLVANAMQEIRRFVDGAFPYKERDLFGSAYLGDLLVTAYSQFSRNRTLGNMVGRGYSVKSAQVEMNMIAEGYYAVKSIFEINRKYEIDMPVTRAVYNILYEKISPSVEMKILEGLMK